MRSSRTTKAFRRHYAKFQRSGKNMRELDAIMRILIRQQPIPARYRDHALQGDWQGVRDCHIEGDWLLLYEINTDADGSETVTFYATGTHENLFG